MDFSLSEEQRDVTELAGRIFTDLATTDRLRELERMNDNFDRDLWRQLAETGLLGVAVEERYGGIGLDFETLCLVLEEAGKRVAPVPLLAVLVSALLPLQTFADEELKQALIPSVVSGDRLITAAWHEPLNDSMQRPSTQAEAVEDGWRIRGEKTLVPIAREADHILLAAHAEDGPLVVLVDRESAGLELTDQQVTTGAPHCALQLRDVRVPASAVIATGPRAEAMLAWAEQRTQVGSCALLTGVGDAMMRMTARYTSEREQFGVPVATFQAVSHRAADSFIDVMVLRLVTQQAMSLLTTQERADDAVAVAKFWAGDVAHRISQASQHLHGGIGVDRDYPLFRYCLWAKQLELTMGGSSAHLSRLGDAVAEWAYSRVAENQVDLAVAG